MSERVDAKAREAAVDAMLRAWYDIDEAEPVPPELDEMDGLKASFVAAVGIRAYLKHLAERLPVQAIDAAAESLDGAKLISTIDRHFAAYSAVVAAFYSLVKEGRDA